MPGGGGRGSGRGGRPARRGGLPRPRKHVVLGGAAVLAALAVVGSSLVAYAKYRSVYDSIHRETVTSAMLGKRPPFTKALNILVIGSDSRTGTHGKFGKDVLGARSDTSMVLHIAPGHKRADIISFPRDTMVPILACQADQEGHPGQQAQPGFVERLNATFSFGGAPCLWKTLEQQTGIRIAHFVEVNFSGFRSIVDDVGGVPICLPIAIDNPQSGLHLSAGKHNVTGTQALAFVRLRENIGEGSDTQRIQRQQYFLASVLQKLKSSNLLADPGRIYSVVSDVAKSLTTDSGLDLSTMLTIADSMKSLSSQSVQFISAPTVPYVGDPGAELSFEQPQADTLFQAIELDHTLPKAKSKKKAGQKATAVAKISPAKVQVQVLNGSGTGGLATTTATGLTGQGFTVTGQGDAANFAYTSSVIEYASAADMPEVNTLKAQLLGPVETLKATGVQPGTLSLILGSGFNGLKTTQPTPQSTSVSSLSKTLGGISGNTNICRDSSAFSGPDTPLPGG
jgi:LCP family protein required for cell wall assembly